jgi:hypothetical protein
MLNLDTQWEPVEHALKQVDRLSYRELKATNLFRDLRGRRRQADKALRQVLSIPRMNHLPIFYGAASHQGFEKARVLTEIGYTSTLHAAFTQCLERVASYIYTGAPKEKVLWIADGGRGQEIRDEITLAKLADVVSADGSTESNSQPTCIVDTVYFGLSHESLAIQLADVCCYVIAHKLADDAAIIPYYNLIKIQIVNSDTRPEFV